MKLFRAYFPDRRYVTVRVYKTRKSMILATNKARGRRDRFEADEKRDGKDGLGPYLAMFVRQKAGNQIGFVVLNQQDFTYATVVHECLHAVSYWAKIKRIKLELWAEKGSRSSSNACGEERMCEALALLVDRIARVG